MIRTLKSGDKIGNWTILNDTRTKFPNKTGVYVYVQCICKHEQYITVGSLRNGIITGNLIGCKQCQTKRLIQPIYKIGEKIGNWTILDVNHKKLIAMHT